VDHLWTLWTFQRLWVIRGKDGCASSNGRIRKPRKT